MRWICAIVVGLIVALLINRFAPGMNGVSTQVGTFVLGWKWILVLLAAGLTFWKMS